MSRGLHMFLAIILISQTIFTSLGFGVVTDAEGKDDKVMKDVTVSEGEDGTVEVQVDWSVKGLDVEADDEETLTTPEEIEIEEAQQGDLQADGESIGTFTVATDGEVKVIFNEKVSDYPEAEGTFTFIGVLKVEEETDADAADGDKEEAEKAGENEDRVSKEEEAQQEADSAKGSAVQRVAKELQAAKQIEKNIIDEIILKREDGSVYEDGDQLDPNEDLELGLEWSLPNNHAYKNGDTFEFDLPQQINIYSEITGDLGEYGSFVVTTDGHVTFTFNENIEDNSDVKGTFWVKTELDKLKVTSSTEELEIVFNDDVAKKMTINIKPEGGQAIHKEGQPVDGSFNTDEIQWTVLINTTKDALENAIVHDPIGDGQELDLESIKLQEIEVNLAGEEVGEIGEATDFTNESTIEELKLALGDTNKAYKLIFKTKIKDSEKDEEGWKGYSNTAFLNSEGKEEKQSGASVSVQRPESLTKTSSAFDAEERSVEWEINANFTEKSLKKDDEIVDEFTFTIGEDDRSDAFEVKEEDIEVLQVDNFNNNGEVDGTSDASNLFDILIDGNKVTYKLKEDTNKAFIIKYKTTAKDGAYIDNDGNISNTVEIDGNTKTSEQHVGQQVGVKGNKGIDYENKTIDWEITINADKQDLRNFVLTDDFSGSGQQLVEGSINIEPDASGADISPNADGERFEIDFGDITETYTITYKTEFTYDFDGEKTPHFNNTVDITYKTDDGKDYELEIEDEVDPEENTKNNGVKNGTANNETKEITWTVDVNYNNLTLTDAKVIDDIADNQSLIDGSVKVYETSIDKDGNITTGDDVTESFKIIAEENLVEVLFSGEIDQSHRVEFKTKDKDDIYNSDEVYENIAQFIPREGEEHELPASVTLPNQGEFLGKSGLHNKDDWTVDWMIDVNKSKSKLTDVTVKDDLGDDGSQILLEDSIKVTKAGSEEPLSEDKYELTVDENKLYVKFPGEITDAYQIKYASYILAEETADLKNEAEIASVEEQIVGSVEKEEEVEVKISTGGGTAEGATGGLTLEKTEKDTERPLQGVTFTLIKTVGDQEIVVREGATNEEGKLEWIGLKYDDYTLKEEIPEGYTGEETQEVTINNDSLEDGVLTLRDEIVNERQTGTAKIIKTDAVTGEELPGAAFEITNETTGQKYTLTTENDGTIAEEVPYGEYIVEEVTAPNGYRVTEDIENITIEIDETTEVTVENEAIIDVSGEKTWHTSEDKESLNAITVELFANGSKVDDSEVTASDDWKFSFTDLDKYDANGDEIDYSIEEVEVDGYASEQDGFDLINIQNTNISGIKVWDEVDSKYRPDFITVYLFANGEEVDSETVTGEADENKWSFTFSNLPKYNKDGEEIEYTIEEESNKGYASEVDNETYEITNTQKTTEVSVEKTWQDDEDATGNRPDSITIQVKNGDAVVEEQAVTADENWTYTFTDLPQYDQEGNEIAYIVDEKNVPAGYAKSIDGNEVTNTRTGTTEVGLTKHWKDENETDRPDVIKVNLLQNGEFLKEHEVTKENNWELIITDLPAFDEEGKAYVYTVNEHDVAGYASEVEGFEITNTRADTKNIEITKKWLDTEETADRPDEIEVELFRSIADGDEELVETYELTADDNWSIEVKDLPSFDADGKAYTYEVKEKAVDGYETTINGFDITNLRVGETEVKGTKVWLDDDSADRPEKVTVVLLANDQEIDELDVTAESEWEYAFTDLPKYDDEGAEIIYTIDEKAVDGYNKSIDGHNITNLRVGKTEVEGTKTWLDDNSKDRPEAIKVKLLANGKGTEKVVEVTAKDDWKYAFTDLDKYDDHGKIITYTVDEEKVKGYEKSISGHDITNLRVGSTEVAGTKTWLDDDSKDRPEEITVTLLANGKAIDQLDVTAESDWKYEFTDLDKYDEQGKEINYTVDEEEVPKGYKKSINGHDITNLRVGTTEVDITKSWIDENDSDRPELIKVNLLQNGDFYKEYEVTRESDWKLNISDLPKYDEQGKAYEYTVTEHDVPGYALDVDGFDITNTRAETKNIEITKTWLDDDSKDRPEEIEVELFRSIADGDKEAVATYELSAEDKWLLEVKDLPAFDQDGKAYTYEIKEKAVDGYETTINGFDITNLRVGETDVTGTKTWKGDKADNRPDMITVHLLQNGESIDTKEVTAEDGWEYSFTDLPAYDEKGVAYEYAVAEDEVKGYKTSVDGFDITNTFIPEDPEKSEDPGSAKDPKDPGESGQEQIDTSGSQSPDDKAEETQAGALPKTATNMFRLLLAGAALFLLGTAIVVIRGRRYN